MKLFAALPVDADVTSLLDRARSGVRGADWHPDNKLHVTLRYYGECSVTEQAGLENGLSSIWHPQFALHLDGVTTLQADRRTALVAKVAPSSVLADLAAACDSAGLDAGLQLRDQSYLPHVTLGYLDGIDPRPAAPWLQLQAALRTMAWGVHGFALYASRPDAGYLELARYSLR